MRVIGLIVPCYNEESILPITNKTLLKHLETIDNDKLNIETFIVYVNDGSKDKTWELIQSYHSENPNQIKGINLAKNAGHQKALLSGLLTFKDKADALISIDADLQDDITIIGEMIKQFLAGSDVVYGARKERKTDTFFKKYTALFFYKLMLRMKIDLVYNHADYRLTSKRVLDALSQYGETHLFLRGIFPAIGYNSSIVYYNRLERAAGESKYPFKKMLAFAIDGITSFSVHPLRIVTGIGLFIFLISLLLSGYALTSYLMGNTMRGWVSTVLPIYFIGGIQLLSVGILGEYIGKIYIEVKKRPRYIVDKILE